MIPESEFPDIWKSYLKASPAIVTGWSSGKNYSGLLKEGSSIILLRAYRVQTVKTTKIGILYLNTKSLN